MVLSKELKRLFSHLLQEDATEISIDGVNISIQAIDRGTKIFLSAPIYLGGNYIPKSVRKSLNERVPFDQKIIPTFTEINESNFQISLNFSGQTSHLTQQSLQNILDEFGWLANQWRQYLDENDKNDLVHIWVK